MTYITIKDPDTEGWTKDLDPVSKTFGWSNHYCFWAKMEAWCTFIDATIPNFVPLNYVQQGLISVVRFVYNQQAKTAFANGVDLGQSIMGKVNEVVNWASNQITTAVNDMRNKIDSEIIEPLRQKAGQIEQSFKDAQSKLSDMGFTVDGFKTDVNTMKSNIASFNSSIEAFDNKLFSFDGKLKGLDSTANDLQAQLKNAQALLNNYKTLIENLTKRVDTLEGKQPTILDFLKKLGLNI